MGDPRQIELQRDEAWPAAAWQEILYGDTHLKASEIIRSVCNLHEKDRKAKKKQVDYWYDGSNNKIIRWDLSNGAAPKLPESHLPRASELALHVADAPTKAKFKPQKKRYILSIVAAASLLLSTIPNRTTSSFSLEDVPLNKLTMSDYLTLSIPLAVNIDQTIPSPKASKRRSQWESSNATFPFPPPPIAMSVSQYSWSGKEGQNLDL